MIKKFENFESDLVFGLFLKIHYETGLPGIPPGSYTIFETNDKINFNITSSREISIFGSSNITAIDLYEFLEKIKNYSYWNEKDYSFFLEKCLPEKYSEYLRNKKAKEFNL